MSVQGARLKIRDRERLSPRAGASQYSSYLRTVDGLSKLVAAKTSHLLRYLDSVSILDPAQPSIQVDPGPRCEKADS